MTIEEAAEFFRAHPKVARPLSLLVETGLGYLKLGQPSPTLSGGEAQRLKLVTQLKRGIGRAENERIRKMRKPGSTLYLLEEPTIGLHMADIDLLLKVLHRLVDEGNTVIVIEHNLSVIAEADYIVDLGPEAGADGGKIVAVGTPEQVAKNRTSQNCGGWNAGTSRQESYESNGTVFAENTRAIRRGSAKVIALCFARMVAYYVHDLNPLIFRLWDNVGPRWYGLAYVLAFACSYALFRLLARRGYADLPVAKVGDFITGAALFGVIVGGRLGYVFFYKPEMLREPMSILRVWEGGMSSHWTNLGDNLVVTAPIGLFFGRCANFINGELYGRATNVSWAMQFPKELTDNIGETERAIAACRQIDPTLNSSDAIVAAVRHEPQVKETLRGILTPRHPSQLYEAFFEGIILFAILWFVRTRMRQPNGVLTGLFFICYAILRIIVENFREPDAALIAGFTRGQFFSFFLVAIGLAFVIAAKLRPTFPKKMAARD